MILDWKKFVLRSDIKNLPLEEQRRKFLEEQLYHDNLLSEQIQRQKQYDFYMSQMQPKGGAGGGGFSGQGVDGPIAGATVTSNVGTTTTNAQGVFTFPTKPTGPITLTGGTDAITGVAFEGELIGYPEYKTISPITTFAHYLKQASEEDERVATLTIDEAVTKTFVSSSDYFGIDLPLENKDVVLQRDYVKESIENNNKVGISAQAVATQIEAITETVGVSLDGSVIASKSRDAKKEIPQFSTKNRKRTTYAALGRSVLSRGNIDVTATLEQVKFFNPITDREERGGVKFESEFALRNQITATVRELQDLSKQEQFTNNYLTTRIQAVNRAQKTTIKNETRNAVENKGTFSNINTVSTSREVEDALKQIEKDKANETTPTLDGKAQSISNAQMYQKKLDEKTKETSIVQVEIDLLKAYVYFGQAKDLPILLQAGEKEETYEQTTFAGTTSKTDITKVTLDEAVELRTESTDEETKIKTITKYIFRPFTASKGEEGSFTVGLRLSEISQSKEEPKNSVTHISLTGNYTATFSTNGGKPEIAYPTAEPGLDKSDPAILNIASEPKGTIIYTLRQTKEGAPFELYQPKVETPLASNLEFKADELTATWTLKNIKGDEDTFVLAISYETAAEVDHIANTLGKKYTIQIQEVGGLTLLPADMEIGLNKETGLNELSLLSTSVPGQTAKLNSIKLVKDSKSGLFNLTAGGVEDILGIAGTQASFDSNNQWKGTKISLSERIEKTYDITISYVDSGK